MYERITYISTALELSSHQKAAESLFVAPQTISKAISEEEKRCGKKLFRRSGRGVEPTEFGVAYLKAAKTLLRAQSTFLASLEAYKNGSSSSRAIDLYVGETPLRGSFSNWFKLNSLRKANPDFRINEFFCMPEACIDLLDRQKIDIAILPGIPQIPGTSIVKIVNVPLKILKLRPQEFDKNQYLSLEELAQVPLALPYESESMLSTTKDGLKQAGIINPRFVSVPLSIKGSVDFVLNGGAILTGPNNELTRLDNRVIEMSIFNSPTIGIPSSFVVSDRLPEQYRIPILSFLRIGTSLQSEAQSVQI